MITHLSSTIKNIFCVTAIGVSFWAVSLFAAGAASLGGGGGVSVTGGSGAAGWNTCYLSAVPTSGTIPLTVTLSGTTWGSISMTGPTTSALNSISRGDGTFSGGVTGSWISRTRARFSAVHMYTTVGAFSITDNVTYFVDTGFRWLDMNASALCTFNSITTTAPIVKGPVCGNNIVEGTEECDDGVNNGLPGSSCSSSCTLVTPKCSISVTPTSGSAPLPVVATIRGFGGIVTTISWGDGMSGGGPWVGTMGGGVTAVSGHTYVASGTYTINANMTNSYSPNYTSICSATVVVMGSGMKGPICGNNIIEGTEQCDDGVKNGNPLYGCDMSCKLTTPKCSLALTPSRGLATFPVSMEVKGSGGVISTIYWGEGPVLRGPFTGIVTMGSPLWSFTTGYTYSVGGTYDISVTVVNPHDISRTAVCTTGVIVDDLEFMPPVPPTTGTTSTGKNTSMTGKTQTGAINVVVPSVVNISADMVKNITQWAYRNGLTALPLSQTQIYAATSRYNVAQMFTQFALRIQKKALVHNSLCNIQKYSDYATFTADMRTTITNICDLGLMGLGSNGKSLIATFNPSEQVTSEQLKTIINRYVPGMITTKTIVQNRNLDVLYWLVQIAVKK